jgi:hypothetical protein
VGVLENLHTDEHGLKCQSPTVEYRPDTNPLHNIHANVMDCAGGTHMPKKKYRVTLEFPVSVRDTLDAIRQQTSAASATEVIRRALATYKAIAEAQAAGERIEIVSTDGTRRQLVVV